MRLQLQKVVEAFWKANSGRLCAALSVIGLLASCDSGSSSSSEAHQPQVPSQFSEEEHLDIVSAYSISTAEALTQLSVVAVLAVQESQRESLSQFLPICDQGTAELNTPIGTAKPGDVVEVNFNNCRATVLNDVVTGTIVATITSIDASSVLTFGATTEVDLTFKYASLHAGLEYLLDYKVDERREVLSIVSVNSDGQFEIEGFRERLSSFQLSKTTDNLTQQFSIDFTTELNSQILNDTVKCRTQNPIMGDIGYYLSEYDYVASSGSMRCDTKVLGAVDLTASVSGLDASIRGKDLYIRSPWSGLIEGIIFHPGAYAMSTNYHAAIREPAESTMARAARVELKQMQDIKYYFDAQDNTAVLIQREVYEDDEGGSDHMGALTLINLSTWEVIARVEEPEEIAWASLDNDLLFVAVGTRVDTYEVNGTQGFSLRASYDFADHPRINGFYGSWVVLPDINGIFILTSGERAFYLDKLIYSSEGRITGVETVYEMPREHEQVRIFGVGKELYLASSYGFLRHFSMDEQATVVEQREYQFEPGSWDLTDIAVIHSGRIFTVFKTAHLGRGTLSSYILGNDEIAEKVQQIDLSINDWVVDFSLTQTGEGLIQWQQGDGVGIAGGYQRFGIDADGAVSLSPVAICEHTEGFTSYRYGNQSNTNEAFVSGRFSVVLFPYDREQPQCIAKPLVDHGTFLENMEGFVSSETRRILYVFRNESPRIAILKQQDNRFEEIDVVSLQQMSEIQTLLMSPDESNLYVITRERIEVFDIDAEGMLHPTPHSVSLSELSANSAHAAFTHAGDRLYIHQHKTTRSGTSLVFSTDLAIYSRNPLNGELSQTGNFSFGEIPPAEADAALAGPLAISPDDRHLYVVSRYFGKLHVLDLSNVDSPTIATTYLDPVKHSSVFKDKHSVRGISAASGFSFYKDGQYILMTMDAGSAFARPNQSEAILASFLRNNTNGELVLRNAVLRSLSSDELAGRAEGYLAPQVIDEKLFTIRTFGEQIRRRPTSVDVYQIDQHGFLQKSETMTSSFFGAGVEQISTWESEKTVLGINQRRETISAFILAQP